MGLYIVPEIPSYPPSCPPNGIFESTVGTVLYFRGELDLKVQVPSAAVGQVDMYLRYHAGGLNVMRPFLSGSRYMLPIHQFETKTDL